MNLGVIDSALITEGGVQEICVGVEDHAKSRERDIPISLVIVIHNANISMWAFIVLQSVFDAIIITGDYNIINQMQQMVISEAVFEVCFQVLAVDDEIIESEEEFTLIVEPTNQNDGIDGNTTIIISDNDCKGDRHCINSNISNVPYCRCDSKTW